jgi:uncharacterized protein with HEPN domain
MSKALRVVDYLGHILQAIERVGRYTKDMDEAAFLNNELVQDAVIRNIEIIGEASNNIQRVNPAFAAQHGNVPWLDMYVMRNRVTHGYESVDFEIVWKTIKRDLPRLHAQVAELRTREAPSATARNADRAADENSRGEQTEVSSEQKRADAEKQAQRDRENLECEKQRNVERQTGKRRHRE